MKNELIIRKILAILPAVLFFIILIVLRWAVTSSGTVEELVSRSLTPTEPLVFIVRVTLIFNALMCIKVIIDEKKKATPISKMLPLLLLLLLCIGAIASIFSFPWKEIVSYYSPISMRSNMFTVIDQRIIPFILSFVIAILGYWEAHQVGKQHNPQEELSSTYSGNEE